MTTFGMRRFLEEEDYSNIRKKLPDDQFYEWVYKDALEARDPVAGQQLLEDFTEARERGEAAHPIVEQFVATAIAKIVENLKAGKKVDPNRALCLTAANHRVRTNMHRNVGICINIYGFINRAMFYILFYCTSCIFH